MTAAEQPTRRLSSFGRGRGIKKKAKRLLALPVEVAGTSGAYARSTTQGWLRTVAGSRPMQLLPLMRGTRRLLREQLFAAQAEALLTARSTGWTAAAPMFRQIAARMGGLKRADASCLLGKPQPSPLTNLAVPSARRPVNLPEDLAKRIVVYTACFGTKPDLPQLFGAPEGLRFLCFTDHPVAAPGWDVIPTAASEATQQFHKICPHKVLAKAAPDAEWSLYLDPDRVITGNLHTLFGRWLLPQDFAMWRNPYCNDWHGLAERHLVLKTASTEAALAQVQACAAEHIPRDRGAYDTGILWRRHEDGAIRNLMDAWWRLEEDGPGADDISLYRLLNGASATEIMPKVLPEALGPAENSIFFARQKRKRLEKRAPLPKGRIPITFLYAEELRDAGITLLRGRQLSKMIAERFPDLYHVTFTADIDSVRDQVVVVNRGAIEKNSRQSLAALRKRNLITISDFLDMPVKPRMNELFDAHMTLSLGQAVDLNRLFPDTPAFHVTHHVNPDVPHSTARSDRLRTGYFGRFSNTTFPETLAKSIDLINVTNAEFTAEDWREAAPHYNCHWIVRERMRAGDERWKPFLKGFVAARCGAVVIVTRDDANAAHYLGDDYPFYAASLDAAELEMAWARVAAAFGGPEWNMAQEIMREVEKRSTDAQVCAEFKTMLDALVG